MVRAFAASAIFLREETPDPISTLAGKNTLRFTSHRLDRTVIALVLVFLAVTITSLVVQVTTSREDQLASAEANLQLALDLTAAKLAAAHTEEAGAPAALPRLSNEAIQPGRRFFLIDREANVVAGHVAAEDLNRKARWLFGEPLAFDVALGARAPARLPLRDGRLASLAFSRTDLGDRLVVGYQPIDEELRLWWTQTSATLAILLCFGAVTIAFTLVFYAQRQRACQASASATRMSTLAELALSHSQCGLWDWKISTDSIFWSDSMHHLLGRQPDGNKDCARVSARLHPDDSDLLASIRNAVAAGEREFGNVFRMRDELGNWRWLRMRAIAVDTAHADKARLFGIVMDVTQERALEEENRRADARLRDAIESLSEAFVLWDENNRLVLCNSKYQTFHGLPTDLVQRGTPYKTLMAGAEAPRVQIEIDHASQPGTGARTYEAQLHDGRWLLINERPTKDGGYVSVGTDITARKAQEAHLIENERRLQVTINDLGNSREAFRRQAGQLAELADRYLEQKAEAVSANRMKAEFLANMNHEIRTPLNHIIGFAEMIETEVFGPCGSDRYVEYARHIGESGSSLMAIISDILDMARIEAGRVTLEREEVPLGALLESATRQVQEAAQTKKIRLEIDPTTSEPAGLRPMFVDPNAVRQALGHILRNSVRLSPTGGRVSVRARPCGDYVNIFIADRACALSPGEIGVMANPFGHIDRMLEDGCKGSGLGLPIARALIELHGGTVRMRSSAEMGSLMMIHLPARAHPVQLDLPMGG
ncbi:MAG TPA: PAS-domain containing protein [Rhabdaerophilum sp.]|nr:PAS-domain containing protein [Rhabdaerophilum sp.]